MPRRPTAPRRDAPEPTTRRRHRRRLRSLSFAFLAVLVFASVASAMVALRLVRYQEQGLLMERAAEVNLVLGSLIASVHARLNLIGTVARVSGASPQSFTDVVGAGDRNLVGMALARPAPEGFVFELAAGPGISVGQTVDGPRADAMRRALEVTTMVATPVMVDGDRKTLGLALGPPAAPPGTVVYREVAIHPGTPSPTTASSPFSELDVSLYASSQPDPAQLVLTNSGPDRPPPDTRTVTQVVTVGDSQWLLSVAAEEPLVGPLVARLPQGMVVIVCSCRWRSSPPWTRWPVAATTPSVWSTSGPPSCGSPSLH